MTNPELTSTAESPGATQAASATPSPLPASAPPPVPANPRQAIVFIHGIFSDHDTFQKMTAAFQVPAFSSWRLWWVDYDFHQSLETSGRQLADVLTTTLSGWTAQDRVVLICHSMGGLVARLAI